jgi:sigma-B regulation protein RsbU (phosphoserine phosphatase)
MNTMADPPTPSTTQGIEDTLRLQNARLAALHEVTLGLTSTFALGEVLQRVVEMAQTLSASAHAHLYLYDPERDVLKLAASHWSSDQRVVQLEPRRAGMTYAVARTGQPVFIEDTSLHPTYDQVPLDLRPGALACLPLVKADHVLGTLNLGYWEPYAFDPETRSFLDLMARQAAIAIENARLYEVAVEKAQLEHELQMARELQASLIPSETPHLAGWDFAAFWQPARLVSGDFYDFVPVRTNSGLPLQGLVIADVSDKGMPAALFMAVARSTIRASLTSACCPSDCIAHANRLLCADSVNAMFITACYGQLDPQTGELVYVNAGHNPPLLYRRAEDQLSELTRTGMALAVDDTHPYTQRALGLEPGDFVLFYTDGVTDAVNAQEQEFGKARLRQVILDRRQASAREMVAGLQQTLGEFVGASSPFDDMTAVVVKRL